MEAQPGTTAEPLDERSKARGRALAIASHPAGNTFRLVFTQHLPTLALVALGAGETVVGLQGAFAFVFLVLQLPTLRAMGRIPKRRILLQAHLFALVGALPLVFFGHLASLPAPWPIAIALLSFAWIAVGICVGETVWFPLLRAYVDPATTGRFFGLLRSGWHLALIVFYGGSLLWLDHAPGSFGPLFATGFGLGVLRILGIAFLPERSERTQEGIRVREAFARVRDPRIRRYLAVVATVTAARTAAVPFTIVWLRRLAGFGEEEVLMTTAAHFAGGLVSLYAWGRVVDRVGPVRVLQTTCTGQALLLLLLALLSGGAVSPLSMVLWFFGLSVLSSGFGVADTQLLFGLTPAGAPARTLVLGAVVVGLCAGAAPILAGGLLQVGQGLGAPALPSYRLLFLALALVIAAASLGVRRGPLTDAA